MGQIRNLTHWVVVRIGRGRVLQCGAWPRADGNLRRPKLLRLAVKVLHHQRIENADLFECSHN